MVLKEIPNNKKQNTNKFQYSNSEIPNIMDPFKDCQPLKG